MELIELEKMAERENIKIYNYNIDNADGIFININNINAIVLNHKRIDTSTKEKCVLAEELGHYYYDAVYSPLCSDTTFINKQEYRAKKWAIKTLIPPAKIKNRTSNYIYEVADELGVTEDMLVSAYNYYSENNYI